MATKIGFLGLGQMGKPMALNLVKAGFRVQICVHRDESVVVELEKAGAVRLPSARQVAEDSQIVVLSLPDPASVKEVMFRQDGVLAGLKPNSIVVDTGTTGLRVTQECSQAVVQREAFWLDSPVSGGVWGAQEGTLTIMVGGDRRVLEIARPVLQSIGSFIVHVGPQGAGQVTKLVNNLMACINTAAVSEAFALGVKAGVDVKALHEVVTRSSGSNWVLEVAAPRTIFAGNYQPGGRLRTMTKDLDLVKEIAKDNNVPLLLGGLVYELQILIMAKGHADEDAGVIAQFYEEILGITLASPDFGASQ